MFQEKRRKNIFLEQESEPGASYGARCVVEWYFFPVLRKDILLKSKV